MKKLLAFLFEAIFIRAMPTMSVVGFGLVLFLAFTETANAEHLKNHIVKHNYAKIEVERRCRLLDGALKKVRSTMKAGYQVKDYEPLMRQERAIKSEYFKLCSQLY